MEGGQDGVEQVMIATYNSTDCMECRSAGVSLIVSMTLSVYTVLVYFSCEWMTIGRRLCLLIIVAAFTSKVMSLLPIPQLQQLPPFPRPMPYTVKETSTTVVHCSEYPLGGVRVASQILVVSINRSIHRVVLSEWNNSTCDKLVLGKLSHNVV